MQPLKDSIAAHAALLNELLSTAIQPHLKRAGITSTTFELLSAVRASGGRATQIELSRRLGITAPSLSEAAKGAIHKGLLEQIQVQSDARAKTLRLTDEGTKILQKILRNVSTIEAKMVEGVTQEEITAAIETLRKVSRNLAHDIEQN